MLNFFMFNFLLFEYKFIHKIFTNSIQRKIQSNLNFILYLLHCFMDI